METIEDILRDMREEGHTGPSCCLEWVGAKMRAYADRIEAAAKRQTMLCHSAGSCDLLFQANFEADKLKTENAELKKCIKGACERLDLGAEPCTDCPYAEIDWLKDEKAKLKAALKPVLNIVMDGETSDLAMAAAVDMACWIYKEGANK